MYPDVRVVERPTVSQSAPVTAGSAVAEPLIIHLPDEEVSQGFIEIIDVSSGNRLITVIEFLSPSNKQPGEGQEKYLQKQRELKAGQVSLVEIDLTRTGTVLASACLSALYRSPIALSNRVGCRSRCPRKQVRS